jgi:protein-tyrosine phosphatase
MIDLHCHILPGIDDGPESLDEAIDMCRAAVADGVKCIVATPHFKPGTYEFTGSRVAEVVNALMAAVQNSRLDIRILPGAEVTVSPEMSANLKVGGYLTLNHGMYFLAEFSPIAVPAGWDTFLLSFLNAGLTPIIAHPERNAWFIHHPEALAAAVQSGVKIQITAMSLTGAFGIEARDFSVDLLWQNLVHVIASDGHSVDFRPPKLFEAVRLAADVVGRLRAEALVTANPLAIIEGRPIPAMEPVQYVPTVKAHNRSWFKRLKDFSFAGTS